MFDTVIDALDSDEALRHAAESRAVSDLAEARLLAVAAHYADLHGVLTEPAERCAASLPGTERLVHLGGDGTPQVAEFAAAELGAELAVSPYAAAMMVGDALDLRHRLPRLWARVCAGEVKPWIARKTAQASRPLSVDAAEQVDATVARWAHSLSWGRLESIIAAAAIAADPDAAARAVEQAEQAQGVWMKPSNDHGVKDIFIRTEAASAIWFDATIDRIADGLRLLGDTPHNQDIRRAHAVGIIAHPQRALDLFHQAAAAAGPDACGGSRGDDGDDGSDGSGGDDGSNGSADGKQPTTSAAAGRVDSRPAATLYVHLGEGSFTRDSTGVARFEGVGPITVEQATRFLGHCHVTIKPVIDLAGQAPVDAYEVPDRLREATHLRSPVDSFPYATSSSRRQDIDHTEAYVDPDHGGPPGQTRLDNLAPMTRFHHRIKTHGRWHVAQPFTGVFIWQSPHGRHYLVDHTGTHKIPDTAA